MNDNHELSDKRREKNRQKPSERLTPKRSPLEVALLVVALGGPVVFITVLAVNLGFGQSNPTWLPWVGVAVIVAAATLYVSRKY